MFPSCAPFTFARTSSPTPIDCWWKASVGFARIPVQIQLKDSCNRQRSTRRRAGLSRSKWVVSRLRLQGDPAKIRKFRNGRLPAEAAIAARAHAAERHLRLIVHRRAVDMTDAAADTLGDPERPRDVATEYSCRQAIFGVIR